MAEAARRDPRLAQIYAAARRHRRALERRNADASQAMYQGWYAVMQDLRPRIDAITQRIDDAKKAGEAVNPAWLYQQERYRVLIDESRTRFNQYAYLVERQATGLQAFAATQAIDDAYYLMRGALGNPAEPNTPEILIRPGAEEMKDIVGFLGNGSPLRDLLGTFGDQTAEAIGKALTVGIVTGQSPIEIARSIRQAAELPRHRAETIARTELHRAFRTATQRTFEANGDVVSGWIWHAAQQRRTCAACWAMHGTFHPVTEILKGHVRCRCAMLPQTKTWEELGIEGVQDERITVPLGSDLFAQLSERDQAYILGKTKHAMFKAEEITLADLATLHKNPVWGDSWQEATIRQAREAATARLRASEKAVRQPRKPKAPKGQGAAPTAPDFKPGAQIRAEIEAYAAEQDKRIEALAAAERAATEESGRRVSNLGRVRSAFGEESLAYKQAYRDYLQGAQDMREARREATNARRERADGIHALLYAPSPATFKATGTPRKPTPGRSTSEQELRYARWEGGSEFFRRIVGTGHLDELTINYVRINRRAFYARGSINIEKGNLSGVITHELGHWLEEQSPGFHDEIYKHYLKRTAGETARKMSEITGNPGYRDNETSKEDRWIDAYSGKDYTAFGLKNSEIVSMTLEQLKDDPLSMIRKDPETFDLVWRLLRSKNVAKRTRGKKA